MTRTKKHGQKHALDKFYTKDSIVDLCLSYIDFKKYELVIEPSAGNGAFSSKIPNCLALDIDPEDSNIIKQDWFTYEASRNLNILVIGNPPFGQQNTLALRFINHAATFAQTIAFVLPKSFMKESVKDRINLHYECVLELPLPSEAFTYLGKDYSVPCVFQVWEYSTELRSVAVKYEPVGMSFVAKADSPDLFFQRVGGRAGTTGQSIEGRSEASNYFLKLTDKDRVSELEKIINALPHRTRELSVGPKSISRNELLKELYEADSGFAQVKQEPPGLF